MLNKIDEVLSILRPNGGYVIWNNDFNTIRYDDGVQPITKKEFDETFKKLDEIKQAEAAAKTATRQALLNKLGITEEEARLLLGGN